MNRRKLILAALLGLLSLALAYAFWSAPRQARVAPSAPSAPSGAAPERAGRPESAPVDEGRRVRLELLARDANVFSEPARNIFRLAEAQPQPLPPVNPEPPPPVAATPAPVASAAPATKPAPHFTCLGFLRKAGRKTVFLTANNEIYLVRDGQSFGPGQAFRVAEITDKQLVIHQTSGGSPITVALADGSSASAFAARDSQRTAPNARRPMAFVPPRVPVFRNAPAEAPVEEPQLVDEPEAEEAAPFEEEAPAPEMLEDNGNDMDSLPMRSMLQ